MRPLSMSGPGGGRKGPSVRDGKPLKPAGSGNRKPVDSRERKEKRSNPTWCACCWRGIISLNEEKIYISGKGKKEKGKKDFSTGLPREEKEGKKNSDLD